MREPLLVCALLLAGCSGAGEYRQPEGASTGTVEETIDDYVEGETAKGEEVGAVTGLVRNDNGAALAEAQVLLLGRSGVKQTGADGRFEIRDVGPGAHALRVDRAGYLSLERDITVVAGKVTRLNITLVPEQALGDPGFREHLHDRWRGATSLTLFDATVRHDHAYPPGGSYNAPCIRGGGLNTGAGSPCYNIPLHIESGTVVPVGTERITFTADWDGTDFLPTVRLRYQAANQDEFTLTDPVAPGQAIEVPVVHPMPDHGHQTITAWRFVMEAEPKIAGVGLVSQHFNEEFVGDFQVRLVAHKGEIPPEAPHPRYWAGGDTVDVAELTHRVTGFPGLPRTRDPQATACSDVLPCFVLPGGSVVPAGTTRLLVELEYEAGTAAAEPILTRKTLGMRTAAVAAAEATLDDLRVDAPVEVEMGKTVYELTLGEGEADPYYQARSGWLFLIAHEGEERGESFTEDCWSVVVGCGGTTYTLRVTAINDNWTPELAGTQE